MPSLPVPRACCAVLFPAFAVAIASTAFALTYVESSTGLGTPTLETGRTEIEMSDVNADGNLDLVSIGDHGSPLINAQEHGIMVWFGDGAGTWSVVQTGDFGYGGVALGDVNGDGHLDAAYGMHHNYASGDFGDQILEVALGDGTGTAWTPWDDALATNGETWGMFGTDLADVDADGDLDVASISFGCCAGVHVYLNQGDGTWTQSFGFVGGNSTQDLTTGDVNGDGYPDLAVAHEDQTIYLGDGAGGFFPGDGNLPPGGTVGRRGPSLGDVDGDGRDDLAVVTSQGGVAVWRRDPGGTWTSASTGLPATGTYEATQLFDLDLDGAVDLVAFGRALLTVWTGDATGQWTPAATLSTPTPGYRAALRAGGDADHNGFPDLALMSEEGPTFNTRNRFHFYKEATVATALAVKPVRPRPAATLRSGSVAFIDWASAVPGAIPATVSLELSTSGPDGPWTPITTLVPDGGRHQWIVPSVHSNDCRIRYLVTAGGETASAVTPGSFTIVGGVAAIALDPEPAGPRPSILTAQPNPFTLDTHIRVAPGGSGERSVIHIYDPRGRLIRVLTAPRAGSAPAIRWDGRDTAGRSVPAGMYFIRLAKSELSAKVVRSR
jgi:hypothetical protein